MAWGSTFDRRGWTGAAGVQIGMPSGYPETQPYGFVTDDVHGTSYDPNELREAAAPAPDDYPSVPIQISDDFPGVYEIEGADGWCMDTIPYPDHDDPAGTGHSVPFGAATDGTPDAGHWAPIYQDNIPPGHGRDNYGRRIELTDYQSHGWESSSAMPPNSKSFPLEAREDTRGPAVFPGHDQIQGSDHEGGWPEPFSAVTVAENAPVVTSDDHIPMRRIGEDDRPFYQQLAVPARNISAGEYQYLPTADSNRYIRRQNAFAPEMARTPEDPWVSLVAQEGDVQDAYDSAGSMGGGWQ